MTSPDIQYLRDLIAIPSVNPMGRDDIPAEWVGERAIAEHLGAVLGRLGLDAAIVGDGARLSVVAEATAGPEAETILVASHVDTVPVDGMEIDPFDPVIEGERVLGRGSCDTKAGMAALLASLERVLPTGRLARNVIIVGEADEEQGSLGVRDVLTHLGARRPDWVFATEPTSLRIVNAHKGIMGARIRAQGRACHSSDPTKGRNAIVALARAILAIDASAEIFSRDPHPLLGSATLSVGVVRGGHAPNIVPDDARLWVDRRTLPGETLESVQAQLEDALAGEGLAPDVVVEACYEGKPPLYTPEDAPAVRAVAAALDAEGYDSGCRPVSFGTDAGVFESAGVPGIVMGPGSIDVAHTSREFVPIDEVEAMTRIFERLLTTPGIEPGGAHGP